MVSLISLQLARFLSSEQDLLPVPMGSLPNRYLLYLLGVGHDQGGLQDSLPW